MKKEFKYGVILKVLFKKYFSKIKQKEGYNKIISDIDNKIVVFVGRNVDFSEYLYLNYILQRDEKSLGYVNELKTFLWETPNDIFDKLSHSRKSFVKLKYNFDKKIPSLIFLKKSNFLQLKNREFEENPLLDLITLQKEIKEDIILVPEILKLEKDPDSLGKKKNTGSLKVMYELFKNYKKAYASLLEPISLQEFIKNNSEKSDIDIAESLKSKTLYKLEKESEIVTGPTTRKMDLNIEQIIKRPNVQEAIKNYSQERKLSKEKTTLKAKKILKNMSADYRASMIKKFSGTLGPIMKKLYNNLYLSQKDVNMLKELQKEYTIILAPSHKSHIDYLILSHLFYINGIVPPHIAAGENLAFFPMGYIFRRSGAFFLKRSFRYDIFYYTIFKEYLRKLVKDRFSIEFFVEGTRSRTGKLLPPKTGMLSMFIDIFFDDPNKKIAILPISIIYEKIIEEKSYVKELSGVEKKKEDLNTMLSNRKVLKARFGNIYLKFAEPIKLDKYFENIKNPDREYYTNKIAYQMLNRINDVTTITTSSIIGTSLLSGTNKDNIYDFNELLGTFLLIHKELVKKGAKISNTLKTPVLALEEGLDFFLSNKHIELIDEKEEKYQIRESRRSNIEYYKNNIIHNFINEAILFVAVRKDSNKRDIKKNTKFLSSVFQDEFIFDPNTKYEINFIQTLTEMIESNHIIKKNDLITVNYDLKGLKPSFYFSILNTFIESYYFCINEILSLKEKEINYRELLKYIITSGIEKSSEFKYEESINKNKFENCINMLLSKDILKKRYEGKVKFISIPSEDQLIEMRNTFSEFIVRD